MSDEMVRDPRQRILHVREGETRPTTIDLRPNWQLKAGAKDTNGHFSAFIARVTEPYPLHIHEYADENFFVLSGEMECFIGGEIVVAKKGDWVTLPAGVAHAPRPLTEVAEVLAVQAPGGFEELAIALAGARAEGDDKVWQNDAYAEAAAKQGWTLLDPEFWTKRMAGEA